MAAATTSTDLKDIADLLLRSDSSGRGRRSAGLERCIEYAPRVCGMHDEARHSSSRCEQSASQARGGRIATDNAVARDPNKVLIVEDPTRFDVRLGDGRNRAGGADPDGGVA